jgi:hypothetical protein
MSATQQRARGDLARRSILIGDHIETPGNTDCLREAAEMFDWEYRSLDDRDHDGDIRTLARSGVPILAIENTPGAENLFKYRPPTGPIAVVVGNERRGISRRVLRLADRVVQIPIASVHINTINVAAAAAVAMYCLSRGRGGQSGAQNGRGRRRPEVLLAAAVDAIELGSALRSAACFGWQRVLLQDHHAIWFAADRVSRSLGRGAARRARNPIHVIPLRDEGAFDEVCVLGAHGDGEPLRRSELALGPRQLVVIPDDSGGFDEDRLVRLGRRVRRVRVEIEQIEHGQRPPFRLIASIALAEIARQVGGWRPVTRRPQSYVDDIGPPP